MLRLRRTTDPVDLLHDILAVRETELTVLSQRREDHIAGSVHVCVGQEIVPLVVRSCLDERDRVLSTYRGHGWALACGVPPETLLAELMGRATGTNGGRGGSAYLSAPEYGFVGENSIVGASTPIANGIAMGLTHRREGGIAVVSIGDGATNQGSVHEAMVFAVARGLPVLFVCENNDWSEMTPINATVPRTTLAKRAASYGMPAVEVDGAAEDFRDTVDGLVHNIRAGHGPAFLEVRVPRLLGHYNADIEHYRSAEDRAAHEERDPARALSDRLQASGDLDSYGYEQLHAAVCEGVAACAAAARDEPHADTTTATDHVTSSEPPRVGALPSEGKPVAYGLAVNSALRRELEERPEVVLFGEDIAIPGGTFGVTRNLRKTYGERVFDTPIAEAAILGAALGASQEGLRPVVEIMWSDFLLVALDQLVNQAANVRYLSNGQRSAPMVVRMQQGITPGSCAQHSQSIEALLTHIPGLKVGLPADAADAYAMTRAAIADPDPVVLIESRALYLEKAPIDESAPVEPVGGARLRREGSDITLITWGRMTGNVAAAADLLAVEEISASVLDLRWLAPLDEQALFDAVDAAGGRALVVHEAVRTGGFGGEILARLAERGPSAPNRIGRLTTPDTRIPASPDLSAALLPSPELVAERARALLDASESKAGWRTAVSTIQPS
ncbi:alpha-ketoacid dehydrogenase subunit alpha/beta [Streptomyces sp. NBC_00063]|uniref:alpha-ketoacid dehydrogenase subunit alpha/beta n=1 Tax=Streptomyces sp. NBC_00063 TaxID=2975638 RepID=UPI003D7126BC